LQSIFPTIAGLMDAALTDGEVVFDASQRKKGAHIVCAKWESVTLARRDCLGIECGLKTVQAFPAPGGISIGVCEGSCGAIPVILFRSEAGASAGQAMTKRPGIYWGGFSRRSRAEVEVFRLRLNCGETNRMLTFRRRSRAGASLSARPGLKPFRVWW
jgi:hypothetical protein